MRLLLVSNEFPPGPGGIGTHAFQLAKHLSKLGWDMTVVARQDYVDEAERRQFNAAQPFQIITLPSRKVTFVDVFHFWRLVRAQIAHFLPDIVLLTGSKSVWVASFLPEITASVAIGHGTEFGYAGWRYSLTRRGFRKVSHVICVSEFTKNYMLSRSIVPRATTVIHNGGDSALFKPLGEEARRAYRERMDMPQSKILLTVGNVTERKGQQVVIRAMPRILEAVPNAHYIIAGLPTLQQEFMKIAAELHVEKYVHFLGRVSSEDLLNLYNLCDISIMMSRHTGGDFEGYGIAVIEAALCGKPSIVSANSGLSEAVLHMQTGIIVPENDSNAAAEAVISLFQNEERLQEMGNNANRYAIDNQTWEYRAQQYDALFRNLIQAVS